MLRRVLRQATGFALVAGRATISCHSNAAVSVVVLRGRGQEPLLRCFSTGKSSDVWIHEGKVAAPLDSYSDIGASAEDDLVIDSNTELVSLQEAAGRGDAESCYRLARFMRKRAEERKVPSSVASSPPPAASPPAVPAVPGKKAAGPPPPPQAAAVLKEIEDAKKAARKARKERIQQKYAIATPPSTSPSSSSAPVGTAGNSSGHAAVAVAVEVHSVKDTWEYWMRRASNAGYTAATVYLANQLLKPPSSSPSSSSTAAKAEDILEAVALYKKAAAAAAVTAPSTAAAGVSSEPAKRPASLRSIQELRAARADAFFNLGTIYFSGAEAANGQRVIAPDVPYSFECFSKAAELGDAGSQYWIGHCLISGEGLEAEAGAGAGPGAGCGSGSCGGGGSCGDASAADTETATRQERSSSSGIAHSVDIPLGIRWMERAALQAHPAASYYLAAAYRTGIRSAEHGGQMQHEHVCTNPDHHHDHDHHHHHEPEQGQFVVHPSRERFLQYLERGVLLSDGDALFCMADLYLTASEGFPKDEIKAIFYLELAAEQSHADALTTLGALHYGGRGGLVVNKRKAFELYNRAGELGSQEAWRNLASMHFLGDGIPKSEEIAREILKHLATIQ